MSWRSPRDRRSQFEILTAHVTESGSVLRGPYFVAPPLPPNCRQAIYRAALGESRMVLSHGMRRNLNAKDADYRTGLKGRLKPTRAKSETDLRVLCETSLGKRMLNHSLRFLARSEIGLHLRGRVLLLDSEFPLSASFTEPPSERQEVF